MQNVLLRAQGLYTFPNHLSTVPQGALLRALNVIINRDSIIECRRGFSIYGTAASSGIAGIAHQLMLYKGRILRHFGTGLGSTVEFDSDGAGTFAGFSLAFTGTTTDTSTSVTGFTSTSQLSPGMAVAGTGIQTGTTISSITNNTSLVLSLAATATGATSLTFSPVIQEVQSGLRIKSVEQNGNLYFTAAAGIKKISVASASGLASSIITDAGGVKALDLQLSLNSTAGFFNQESTVAYRLVWGIKDAATNLILGAPSARAVINNPLTPLLIDDFNTVLYTLDTLALSTGINAQNYVTSFKTPANSSSATLRTNVVALATALDADIPGFASSAGLTTTGDITNTSTQLINLASTTGLVAGQFISATGVPTGTKIVSIVGSTVTMSAAATATTVGVSVTFSAVSVVVSSGVYTVKWPVSTNPTNIVQVGDAVSVSGVTPTTYNTGTTYFPVTAVTASSISYTMTSDPGTYTSGTATVARANYKDITAPLSFSTTPTTEQLVSLQDYFDSIVAQLQVEPSGIITTPSVFNSLGATTTSGVTIKSSIPRGITTAYFYQLYRTSQTTSSGVNALSSFDPGDEEQLVYEASPTNTDLTNGYITITDITPDSFLGSYLYTNPNTGDGILQANDVPPIAKDITTFKGYTFYANTETRQRKQLNMLSVSELISGTSTFTISDGTTTNTYTFVSGVAQIQTVTTVADIAGSLNSKYFNLYSGNNVTRYYVWYSNGAGVDPAVSGATGVKVTYTNGDSANTIATLTRAKLNQLTDFTITGATNTVIVTNNSVGISTAASNGTATPGFSYAVGTSGTGEDATNKKVLISTLSTPAQQVDETSQSLIRVLNKNSSDLVYGYYLSGPEDVPGQILFEAKRLGQAAIHFTVNSAATGSQFDPILPTSGSTVATDDESFPNRIYYSKFEQPEAVPIVNTIDVGAKDKPILRVLSLRDNLFVLKEEGIFRISGLVAPFSVNLFDSSSILEAPDSAVVLNNLIYCYASQGVVRVSDTGVEVVSRPIEDKLIKLNIPNYTNFSTATFGVSYESDRCYYLFTVTNTSDTYATQCFRFNTFTSTWTEANLTKRCGLVNSDNDKLYLGPSDTNYVEQERKRFDRSDYSDREIASTISSSSVSDTVVTLPSVANMSVGDVFTQTQYLTISQFNLLINKLNHDSILTTNYTPYEASAGDALNTKLDSLIAAIAADAGRISKPGFTAAGTYTALSPASATFLTLQTAFNTLIGLLNNDVGTGAKTYQTSDGTVLQEIAIVDVTTSTSTLTLKYTYPLIQGPVTVYNHISCIVQWAPQFMQDVSMSKQVSEGTLIFEDSSYSDAILSFASDLSPGFFEIPFVGFGNGNFGNNVYGTGNFGGNGSSIPFRTLIPRDKQRCRFIMPRFAHAVAREGFSIYGLSLTYNQVSQRAYR